MKKEVNPITVKKSYSMGMVAVGIELKCRGWQGPSAKITASADITSEQARKLGMDLMVLADAADAKVAAKEKSDENRRKYREREIAAGRLIVMKGSPF